MALTLGSLLLLVILGVITSATYAQLMLCPQVCSCIWRNGKQTTICENQNLISIPNQISPSTQVLDLNTNNFQILPSKAFQERGLINLQKLFLPRCKLGAIADDAFTQLTNLVELDLSENLLTTVPVKALTNCTNLRRLLLNNNHIATLTAEAFAPLNSLKFLNLSGCQTHTIEARAFWGLHDLEYLYLHSNQLTTLPYAVVQDLPALYSFDLYRNPWHCNCEMRATREWMIRNNVGQSIPPACELPLRLSGLMWNSLDLDDFACEPDIITTTVELTKSAGSNGTLSCLVKGLPEPKIYWYIDDGYHRNLSSPSIRGEKYLLSEEHTSEGTVNSILTIINLDANDDTGSFICSAENRAGVKSKNFTVSVLPSSPFGVSSNWSRVEMAGGIVGILICFILACVIITLILIRSKRFSNVLRDAKKLSANGDPNGGSSDLDKKPISHLMKTGTLQNNMVYPSGGVQSNYGYHQSATSIPQHLSMLGLDGIDKKPEIFLTPNGYQLGNGTPVPDLVQGSNGGYELNTYANGMTYPQQYNHAHQSSDTSMMMTGDSYDLYPTSYHQDMYQQQQQQQENDGLFRAVMVQPPMVSSSQVISNPAHSGSPQPQHHFNQLSASTLLYNHYLSQHDLRVAQQQHQQAQQQQQQAQQLADSRISPDSFTNLHHRHLMAKSPYLTEATQSYIIANPQTMVQQQQQYQQEMYSDDDVFHPSPSQSHNLHHHQGMMPPMFQAPLQPIYGTSSKRSSPWSMATVVPNHQLLTTTPTPNMMIRYSPDEGYGEDGSATTATGSGSIIPVGQLEGTEV